VDFEHKISVEDPISVDFDHKSSNDPKNAIFLGFLTESGMS